MGLAKKYKELVPKYSYRIYWSDEDQAYIVSVDELKGCMTHGETPEKAIKMGHEAVELYLETLVDSKMEVPIPISMIKASGEFIVRSYPELHEKLIQKAHDEGYKTLNKFIVESLEELVISKKSKVKPFKIATKKL